MKFENFDEIWGQLGDPALVEQRFLDLLPEVRDYIEQAVTSQEYTARTSIYLQMLSQLALAQACLQKFDAAHATLDQAESQVTSDYELARVRILCERGRTFQQAGDVAQARSFFEQSYAASLLHGFDKETINAAHMIAIVALASSEKIAWNHKALDLTMKTNDISAQSWKGPLYNNLGTNYLEVTDYVQALQMFQLALVEFQKDPAYAGNMRFAQFRVAQVLRKLSRFDEALDLLQPQLQEYDVVMQSNQLGMPQEMFILMRGWLYEELAMIYKLQGNSALSKKYVRLALQDLAENTMFAATDSTAQDRIKKLQHMI